MSHILLSQQYTDARPDLQPRLRRRPLIRFNMGPVSVLIFVMVVVGFLGLLSLTHLNAQSTKGYMINRLDDEYQRLLSDSEINEMLILQARSMKTIENHPSVVAMRAPEHVVYLDSIAAFAKAN